MKALIYHEGKAILDPNHKVPSLRDDYIIVRPAAIALNPTDWKHVAGKRSPEGGVLGCDYAGIVEQVGKNVTKHFKKGDRVAGIAHGSNFSNPEDGVFAEYAAVKGDLQMKIPDSLSFEKAATLGVGIATVGQGLYQKALKLNLPTDPIKHKAYVLIYGGSTATGTLGIQFARLSGYTVLTTCSPRNFDLVKSLGAEAAFDYSDPDVGRKIREYSNDGLKLAWDTIGEGSSPQICADALSSDSAGCKYGTILSGNLPREDIGTVHTLAYTIFGEQYTKGGQTTPASPEDFAFASQFMSLTEKLLAEGKIKTHPERVEPGGLAGALDGLERLKEGKVSGEKLVYRIAETP